MSEDSNDAHETLTPFGVTGTLAPGPHTIALVRNSGGGTGSLELRDIAAIAPGG